MKGMMTIFRSTMAFRACYRRYCTAESNTAMTKVHPYCKIHPWKSENEFIQDLVKNVIYNEDGIIAINKPYGIPLINKFNMSSLKNEILAHKIVGAVNYSIQDALPYLAKELDVPILIPCIGAEKYMSGVYIFGINDEVCQQIEIAKSRVRGRSKKYWAVTIRVPNEIKGKCHLAMTLTTSASGEKKPIIMTKWTNNSVKRNEVKILNIDYKVLSNSTHNLSSLIEMVSSNRMWMAIRLFASTMLYSPILGDNIHGSRVQESMGTWLRVNPFADSTWNRPKINQQLLDLLDVTSSQQEIIPASIHLRSMHLIYGKKFNRKDIIIEAPLIGPFSWTCEQLKFKIPDEARNTDMDNEGELANL